LRFPVLALALPELAPPLSLSASPLDAAKAAFSLPMFSALAAAWSTMGAG
jgi:hypothetical protein